MRKSYAIRDTICFYKIRNLYGTGISVKLWNSFSPTKFSVLNNNKTLYLAHHVLENESSVIGLYNQCYDKRICVGAISCKQKVQDAKIIPNNQLLMTKERFSQDQDNDDFNTIRIYRIISKDKNSQLSISDSNNDMIAEVNMHKQIQNFEFHSSGLKIIVVVDNSIKIINLIKDTTTSF